VTQGIGPKFKHQFPKKKKVLLFLNLIS
jgi:hypothetical protein